MGVGGGIALLVIGGILSFGIRDRLTDFDLSAIGYVCMAGGVLMIILSLVLQQQRQRSSHVSVVERRNVDDRQPPPAV